MQASAAYPSLRVTAAPMLPVAQMVLGKPVHEAAALLPRLFNLCRVAQATAARAAFGLAQPSGWQDDLCQEIIRAHVVKLCLKWPALLSIPALTLPRDWIAGGAEVRAALFGPAGRLPETSDAFRAMIKTSGAETSGGVLPVLRAIGQVFVPSEACRPVLPDTTAARIFEPVAQENSVAARQAQHPVLRGIEADMGRGPFWTAVAVAYDLEASMNGQLPAAELALGRAVVPAARGYYGITARVQEGHVTAFDRVTPTDHLLAPGGGLQHAIASLPAHRAAALAPLLLSILDPCFPVALDPVSQDEAAHA